MSHVLMALSLPSPPSPIIFEAGPLAMRWYGLCIALGIAVATFITSRELARRGHDGALALDALFFVVPLGFVGARVYHVLTDYDLYADDPFPGVFEVWNGGLGIYGAVVGGFLGVLIFARFRGISPLMFADAVAPGLILAQAIGRWGNYFNQELFGRPSDLPWAIRIAPENRPQGFADAASFHPTFLYESIWNLLVFFVLLYIARRFDSRLKNGDIFLLYVSLYSVGRFFVEALRIDPAFLLGDFRGNLFVASVLALTFALIFFLRHASTGRKRPSAG
ncbi:prolipoprotein diacylglyceryl transferase [Rubrobacter marinus]|uniref:Phosphatidylglycerol--prolipoprotein diacylglyceryl transferase n=1 Tax=Rubrobacter marinus TaxID=2653852 RepID=A0A6G8PY72_9ACTN|nr:prolipoprotein diacylglyceryl transferase [Rubrobacter marinus]QIN79182.1 prolipoprotein diacylglyceryl transferase [Rubrobacter marinus]